MIETAHEKATGRPGMSFGSGPATSVYIKFSATSRPEVFQPAVNAYLLDDRVEVCVDLAGVEASSLHLSVDHNRLYIRGVRDTPSPQRSGRTAGLCVLAMEIDHGPFERVIDLPELVDPDHVTAEQANGLLWIRLPLLRS